MLGLHVRYALKQWVAWAYHEFYTNVAPYACIVNKKDMLEPDEQENECPHEYNQPSVKKLIEEILGDKEVEEIFNITVSEVPPQNSGAIFEALDICQ